jgi:methyl-accepting chemotaxis protein
MDKIVQSVSDVATIFGEIRDASKEQNSGILEVSRSVAQIDKMTQMNADMVEHAAAAARDMQEQMEFLLESVSAFEFEGGVKEDDEEHLDGNVMFLEP